MKNIILQGFTNGTRQWRFAAIVYVIQFCLALTLGMQVYEVMKASIGNSLEINQLLQRYDHTVLMDFLKVHGASITPLMGQLRWLLLVWMVFAVFTDGGLLYGATASAGVSGREFWQAGATYFFRFLIISLVFLLLALVWTAVLFLPVALLFQPSINYFSSEKYTVWLVLLVLGIWLTGLGILLTWSVLGRLQVIRAESGIWRAVKDGIGTFFYHKRRFLSVLALFAVIQLVLVLGYYHLESLVGLSAWGVLGLFVLQQAVTFVRIQLKQVFYSTIAAL